MDESNIKKLAVKEIINIIESNVNGFLSFNFGYSSNLIIIFLFPRSTKNTNNRAPAMIPDPTKKPTSFIIS